MHENNTATISTTKTTTTKNTKPTHTRVPKTTTKQAKKHQQQLYTLCLQQKTYKTTSPPSLQQSSCCFGEKCWQSWKTVYGRCTYPYFGQYTEQGRETSAQSSPQSAEFVNCLRQGFVPWWEGMNTLAFTAQQSRETPDPLVRSKSRPLDWSVIFRSGEVIEKRGLLWRPSSFLFQGEVNWNQSLSWGWSCWERFWNFRLTALTTMFPYLCDPCLYWCWN